MTRVGRAAHVVAADGAPRRLTYTVLQRLLPGGIFLEAGVRCDAADTQEGEAP